LHPIPAPIIRPWSLRRRPVAPPRPSPASGMPQPELGHRATPDSRRTTPAWPRGCQACPLSWCCTALVPDPPPCTPPRQACTTRARPSKLWSLELEAFTRPNLAHSTTAPDLLFRRARLVHFDPRQRRDWLSWTLLHISVLPTAATTATAVTVARTSPSLAHYLQCRGN
jgi:hypothetical protein